MRSIHVPVESLDGLPADYIEAHPAGDDGLVTITTDYPDAVPFRMFSRDAEARRALLIESNNRAWPGNDELLGELLDLRDEQARLLGYESYPDYDTEVKNGQDRRGDRRSSSRSSTAAADPAGRPRRELADCAPRAR